MAGDPKFEASQELPDFPYARYAGDARPERHPRRRPRRGRRRLGARRSPPDRPAVLEVVTDPEVPPLPPHITLEQAKAFASSVLKGDPGAQGHDPPVAAAEAGGCGRQKVSGAAMRRRRRRARFLRDLRRGRAQRTLAAATALSALPLGAEIYFEHYRGSFGDKWMWTPVVLSPALTAAGVAGGPLRAGRRGPCCRSSRPSIASTG